jgi:hypothetical protein
VFLDGRPEHDHVERRKPHVREKPRLGRNLSVLPVVETFRSNNTTSCRTSSRVFMSAIPSKSGSALESR